MIRRLVLLVFLVFVLEVSRDRKMAMYMSEMVKRTNSEDAKATKSELRMIEISTNPGATLAGDIESIVHCPDESAVYINLKSGAKCPRPSLRGRLSGPAIVMLDWTIVQRNETTTRNAPTLMKGWYQAPFPGLYLLEIVAIFCEGFVHTSRRSNTSGGSERFEGDVLVEVNFNFKNSCVEDTWNHRVTSSNASILVESKNADLAFWVLDKDGPNHSHLPVHTRFQPQGCREASPHCEGPMNTDRYRGYSFQWPNNTDLSFETLQQDKLTSICFIGWSHSRAIVRALSSLNIGPKTVKVNVVLGMARFPHEVNPAFVQSLINDHGGCDKLIIGVGQWSAGYPGRRPAYFSPYYQKIKTMLSDIHEHFPNIEIFARSIHYNPLGDKISECPPTDWRNPDVIDGYNLVIEKAVRELGGSQSSISYVDTNFIVGPMWDSSPDWCHLSAEVQRVEALYLMAVALGVVSGD